MQQTLEDFINSSLKNGVQYTIRKFSFEKQQTGKNPIFDEKDINDIGYHFLYELNRIDDALELFKYNVESFPQSANAYDSLGEAYFIKGEIDSAIYNYKKSINLNPDNKNAVHMLRQLRSNH